MADRPDLTPVLAVAGLGAAAWAGYEFWYKPEQARKAALAAAVQNYQASHGGSKSDALANIGAIACQGAGLSYGIPPQLSAGICAELGPLSASIVRGLPGIATGAVKGAYGEGKTVVKDVYRAGRTVVKDVVSAPLNIAKNIGKAFTSFF